MEFIKNIGIAVAIFSGIAIGIVALPYLFLLVAGIFIIVFLFQLIIFLFSLPFGKDPLGWRNIQPSENIYSSPSCGSGYGSSCACCNSGSCGSCAVIDPPDYSNGDWEAKL